ncbi:MAG: hypothetical protein WC282_02535 [Bacilli bacterium]|jgi:hypothetical protein
MVNHQQEDPIKTNPEKSDENHFSLKKKGFSVLYLPAIIIAVITISLLVILVFGNSLRWNNIDSEPQTRQLHKLDFTSEEAAFDETYSYLPLASEEPSIYPAQGFGWSLIGSGIKILIPDYEGDLSFDFAFGAFNLLAYETTESSNVNYEAISYSLQAEPISSKNMTDVTNNDTCNIAFQEESIAYVEVRFKNPITTINNQDTTGYLYLHSISVTEVR